MPSGLLQTVLCDEKLQTSYYRLDELFYYTMQEVVNRLENNTTVLAPVDNGRNLTPRNSDVQKMINWKIGSRVNWKIWMCCLRTTALKMMHCKLGMAFSIMIIGTLH